MMILFIISCSIYTIAQDYYYYKGNKIPLTLNENKVCISIPKVKKSSERILANVSILNKIKDEDFDIFVIDKSDSVKLTSRDFWEEYAEFAIITPSYITTEKVEVFSSSYLSVRLKREQDSTLLSSYAERYGLRIVKQDSFMPLWYVLVLTQDCERNTLECANTLWESGDFAASEPDLCSKKLTYSNDPLYNQQWGLHNSYHPDIDISVSSAWNYATGKNIKIAILDDGVVRNHKDLESNIGSLYYDALYDSTSDYRVYGEHGTHCAGIAAAVKDNGKLIAGVAPDATIVPINNRLDIMFPVLSGCWANGINWAIEHDVDVISCSWGALSSEILDNAIQNALTNGRHGKGCVVVFAAGNDSIDSISYPANCNDKILVVGAIDSTGVKATSSNYGTGLDLVAPGVDILSTVFNDTVGYKSGTSMACPHVAGVAALILERNSELTVDQVNSIICSNTKKVPNLSNYTELNSYGSWSEQYGYGLVDAYNAVINTPDTVYIQNDTITGTRTISAGSIYVGSDVTNTMAYGDVVLGQGDITLKADYVEIKNSTTVPLGTTLTIEN